jgi:hypothetical protein
MSPHCTLIKRPFVPCRNSTPRPQCTLPWRYIRRQCATQRDPPTLTPEALQLQLALAGLAASSAWAGPAAAEDFPPETPAAALQAAAEQAAGSEFGGAAAALADQLADTDPSNLVISALFTVAIGALTVLTLGVSRARSLAAFLRRLCCCCSGWACLLAPAVALVLLLLLLLLLGCWGIGWGGPSSRSQHKTSTCSSCLEP